VYRPLLARDQIILVGGLSPVLFSLYFTDFDSCRSAQTAPYFLQSPAPTRTPPLIRAIYLSSLNTILGVIQENIGRQIIYGPRKQPNTGKILGMLACTCLRNVAETNFRGSAIQLYCCWPFARSTFGSTFGLSVARVHQIY
jgi:hypothetical protein